jgi:hypothetical protein
MISATDISTEGLEAISPSAGWHTVGVGKGFYDPVGPEEHFWTTYPIAAGFENQWHKSTQRENTGDGGYSYKFGSRGDHDYANAAEGALELIPIRLEGTSRLSFSHWIDSETDSRYPNYAWDGGCVEVSLDGESWNRIAPNSGWYTLIENDDRSFYPSGGIRVYSGEHDWQTETIDLPAVDTEVYIRFRFGTDLYSTAQGWHIDDITIETEYSSIEYDDGEWSTPEKFEIAASPNPFNAKTKISFTSGSANKSAHIEIFNIIGKRIKDFNIKTQTGVNSVVWNAGDASSGIYLCKVKTENNEAYERLILVK